MRFCVYMYLTSIKGLSIGYHSCWVLARTVTICHLIRALGFVILRRRILVWVYAPNITPFVDPSRPLMMSQAHPGHARGCICSKCHLPRTIYRPCFLSGGLAPYLQHNPWGRILGLLCIFLTGVPRPSGFTKIQKGYLE